MRAFVGLLLVGTLSLATTAQTPVSLTGRVERVPSNPCNGAATHKIACTEILLRSATVDLTTWEGRMADLSGESEGTLTCPLINISDAVAAPQSTSTFSLGGFRINSTVIFTTTAPVGSVVAYFFSCEPGFLPIANFGTVQLNPLTNFIFWQLDVSIGVALRTVRIPNVPGLVGQVALFQTAFVSVTPTLEVKLLNAGCFTIQ